MKILVPNRIVEDININIIGINSIDNSYLNMLSLYDS